MGYRRAMHRLFVAIVPPPDARAALIAAMGGVIGARWQTDAQLHLTLRFIGEVDRHRASDIVAALGQVPPPHFGARLAGPGSFERNGRIDSLWVGVTPHAALAALARRIDQALVRHAGLGAETRAFVPHITVARFGRVAGPIAGWVARPPPAAAFTVQGFDLCESHLGHGGAEYRCVAAFGHPALSSGDPAC